MKRLTWLYALIAINIIALADAIYLTYHHYKIHILSPSTPSFCTINSIIDCDQVALSPFAFFMKMPVSSIGIFAYLFLLIFLVIGLFFKREKLEQLTSVVYSITLLMVGFSIYELLASILVVKSICIMCCVLYLCVALMAICAKMSLNQSHRQIVSSVKNFFTQLWPFNQDIFNTKLGLVTLLISVVVGYGADRITYKHFVFRSQMQELEREQLQLVEDKKNLIQAFYFLPVEKINTKNTPSKGANKASVEIVEFSDFECPACVSRAATLLDIIKKFPGSVRLFFKHYPLDRKCNFSIKRKFHESACQAAYFSHCAFEQNKFWPIHDELFANRYELGKELYDLLIKKYKMNKNALNRCIKTQGVRKVTKDAKEGNKLKVTYTPTIYINGRKISDIARRHGDIEILIKALLEE